MLRTSNFQCTEITRDFAENFAHELEGRAHSTVWVYKRAHFHFVFVVRCYPWGEQNFVSFHSCIARSLIYLTHSPWPAIYIVPNYSPFALPAPSFCISLEQTTRTSLRPSESEPCWTWIHTCPLLQPTPHDSIPHNTTPHRTTPQHSKALHTTPHHHTAPHNSTAHHMHTI